ncbi:MAG: thiamine-phosphate kinase [Planctomycetes bacterium]|nr:thiamine-phosphate kinase [Planctomycetota bacterium]
MSSGEAELIQWLTEETSTLPAEVELGIGDDMAVIRAVSDQLLITSDMLLDGVHFDRATHDLAAIGRKAVACSLSDCAAMAVRPVAATVSVALPDGWEKEDSKRLYAGIRDISDRFHCPIVGGDTTSWNQRMAIDVTMLAAPYPGIKPVRRDGAGVGDALLVTGALGGSLLGRHMTFTPRVEEARRLAEAFGNALHAMMDISDGLALDLHRMCRASGVGAVVDRALLESVISSDAERVSRGDGVEALQHALSDGEDYELLIAVDPEAGNRRVEGVDLHRVGGIVETGLSLRSLDGSVAALPPQGFEHLR